MIVAAFAILGAVLGIAAARRREGTPADIAQYAVGFAVAFGVAGLVVALLARAVLG